MSQNNVSNEKVETMVCISCKELVNVTIEHNYIIDEILNDNELNVCPLCGGNNLSHWTEERTCPKCNSKMDFMVAVSL